mgnify:CR=1 FL=1
MSAPVIGSVEHLRMQAISALRQGLTVSEVAKAMGKSASWLYKCQALYRQGGTAALGAKSRRPRHSPTALTAAVRTAIRQARTDLETEAAEPHALCYIGAPAVRQRLRRMQVTPLPSIGSIERELRHAGLTHPRPLVCTPEVSYPQLKPTQALELVQADIFPRYLPGGALVSCFHAIDVVSHYPVGLQRTSKRATDACDFLLQAWREVGVPLYTQVDNEGCFSGGFTHAHVLGQVVRLALWAGTQLLFSPYYHPASNGTVERFHQEYDRNTWQKQRFATLDEVAAASERFFCAYRQSAHQRRLHERTPAQLHVQEPHRTLPGPRPAAPLPLYAGKLHFLRKVDAAHQVRVLNVDWQVAAAPVDSGVWVTLDLTTKGALLAVFDAAPDALPRHCLATYPFPLQEPVLAHLCLPCHTTRPQAQRPSLRTWPAAIFHDVLKVVPAVRRMLHSTMS